MPRFMWKAGIAAWLLAASLAGASFGVSPVRLNFGGVKVGTAKSLTFKINPPGAMDFELASSDGAFQISGEKRFRAGAETTITVSFAPGAAGEKQAKITVSAPGEGITKTVTVSGSGE